MLLEEGVAMTSVFSWQNSISFYLALFCTPRPNLSVTRVFFFLIFKKVFILI